MQNIWLLGERATLTSGNSSFLYVTQSRKSNMKRAICTDVLKDSVLTRNKEAFQRYRSSWLQQSSLFPLICQMSISSTVQNKLYCIKLNYRIINNSALLTASAMPRWNPSLLTSTFWGSVIRQSIFRSSAPETIRHFSATIQPKAEQLWEILKQSDRSNYHLPTSSAPTLMKSTTLQQTPYALKLTFTFVNN